jgi:Ni/Co efflux regulator RcnB
MKTLIIATASLSLLGAAAAQAQPGAYGDHRGYGQTQSPVYVQNQAPGYGHGQGYIQIKDHRDGREGRGDEDRDGRGYGYDRDGRHDNGHHYGWARGQRLPQQYWGGSYVVTDWRARHLRQPARGYRWVRVDNNYVLAAIATGLIADVLSNR